MESLGFRSVVLDPRPQILEVAELVLAGPTAGIERLAVERAADELLEMRVRLELGAQGSDHGRPAVVRQLVAVLAIQLLEREPRRALDRKSTRLNSSHVAISYAVFCLKKKKKVHFFVSVEVIKKKCKD